MTCLIELCAQSGICLGEREGREPFSFLDMGAREMASPFCFAFDSEEIGEMFLSLPAASVTVVSSGHLLLLRLLIFQSAVRGNGFPLSLLLPARFFFSFLSSSTLSSNPVILRP